MENVIEAVTEVVTEVVTQGVTESASIAVVDNHNNYARFQVEKHPWQDSVLEMYNYSMSVIPWVGIFCQWSYCSDPYTE